MAKNRAAVLGRLHALGAPATEYARRVSEFKWKLALIRRIGGDKQLLMLQKAAGVMADLVKCNPTPATRVLVASGNDSVSRAAALKLVGASSARRSRAQSETLMILRLAASLL